MVVTALVSDGRWLTISKNLGLIKARIKWAVIRHMCMQMCMAHVQIHVRILNRWPNIQMWAPLWLTRTRAQ